MSETVSLELLGRQMQQMQAAIRATLDIIIGALLK